MQRSALKVQLRLKQFILYIFFVLTRSQRDALLQYCSAELNSVHPNKSNFPFIFHIFDIILHCNILLSRIKYFQEFDDAVISVEQVPEDYRYETNTVQIDNCN